MAAGPSPLSCGFMRTPSFSQSGATAREMTADEAPLIKSRLERLMVPLSGSAQLLNPLFENLPWKPAGVITMLYDHLAVDDHVFHSDRVLMGIDPCAPVGNFIR